MGVSVQVIGCGGANVWVKKVVGQCAVPPQRCDPFLLLQQTMSGEDQEVRTVDEDGSNGGSGSPSPGDTLPWNLGKTQRSRRSGGGSGGNGSVLDPAERAVIRIAGKRGHVCLICITCLLTERLLCAVYGLRLALEARQ